MTLAMYPDCQACGRDLPPESDAAVICSFECTFCRDCGTGPCPNCGGVLVARPTRTGAALVRNPPTGERRFDA